MFGRRVPLAVDGGQVGRDWLQMFFDGKLQEFSVSLMRVSWKRLG
jgi:hypothetical protein